MVYLVYEQYKLRFEQTMNRYIDVLDEQEELFQRTQPKTTRLDQDRVSGGESGNKFDEYVIAKDKKKIDKRITEIKRLLANRKHLLEVKESELRASKEAVDVIYCMRVLDRMKINVIASKISYSEAQIYRYISRITESVDKIREQWQDERK